MAGKVCKWRSRKVINDVTHVSSSGLYDIRTKRSCAASIPASSMSIPRSRSPHAIAWSADPRVAGGTWKNDRPWGWYNGSGVIGCLWTVTKSWSHVGNKDVLSGSTCEPSHSRPSSAQATGQTLGFENGRIDRRPLK